MGTRRTRARRPAGVSRRRSRGTRSPRPHSRGRASPGTRRRCARASRPASEPRRTRAKAARAPPHGRPRARRRRARRRAGPPPPCRPPAQRRGGPRRRRRAAGTPRAGSRGARTAGPTRRSGRSGCRLRPFAAQALQLLRAPLSLPFRVSDAPAKDEVYELGVLAGERVDLVQPGEHFLEDPLARLDQEKRFLAPDGVGEEDPQQQLVTELDRQIALAAKPRLELGAAVGRQPVDAPRTGAVRRVLTVDQPLVFEPAQLRVALAVARCPEIPRRSVDRRLDLVPRARRDREET